MPGEITPNPVSHPDADDNTRIRLGAAADADALKCIDSVVPLDPDRAANIDGWLREDTVLVAEQSGQAVGYGVFNHTFFHKGTVEMLMVHPAFRGQRIGEALLSALEQVCDTPKLFVTTNLSNQRMQRLLTRLSYRACGLIDELDAGDPELVFFKRVSLDIKENHVPN